MLSHDRSSMEYLPERILKALASGEKTGMDLRKATGVSWNQGLEFYHRLFELKEKGWVEYRPVQTQSGMVEITEEMYSLTDKGRTESETMSHGKTSGD
jgi:predicted transcriptional regulator